MDNMKIEIMNTVSKQIDSLKFQQKLVEEQESLFIFCPKCRKKHLLRECPIDVKGTNKCEICTENHATEKCPSIPRLKAVFEGGKPEAESLHTMGARRNWPHVTASMAPELPLHFLVIMHIHISILTLVILNIGSMGTNIIMGNPPNLGNKDGEGQTIHTIPILHLCCHTHLLMHLTQCHNHHYLS